MRQAGVRGESVGEGPETGEDKREGDHLELHAALQLVQSADEAQERPEGDRCGQDRGERDRDAPGRPAAARLVRENSGRRGLAGPPAVEGEPAHAETNRRSANADKGAARRSPCVGSGSAGKVPAGCARLLCRRGPAGGGTAGAPREVRLPADGPLRQYFTPAGRADRIGRSADRAPRRLPPQVRGAKGRGAHGLTAAAHG